MHIGASNDFAPIGSVDTPFIRDVVTQEPIIPGSSIKGKLRTLLAKSPINTINGVFKLDFTHISICLYISKQLTSFICDK